MDQIDTIRSRHGMYLDGYPYQGPQELVLHRHAIEGLVEAGPRRVLRLRRAGAEVTVECDGLVAAEQVLAMLQTGAWKGAADPSWPLLLVSALSSRFALDVVSEEGWWSWRGERGRPVASGEPLRRGQVPGTVLRFTPDEALLPDAPETRLLSLEARLDELALLHPGLQVELEDGADVRFTRRWPLGLRDWLLAQEVEPVRVVDFEWGEARVRAGFGVTARPGVRVHGFVNGVRVPAGDGVEALRAVVEQRWPPEVRGTTRVPQEGFKGWLGALALELPRERATFAGPLKDVLRVPGLREGLTEALRRAFNAG